VLTVASVTLVTHTYDGLQNRDTEGGIERETGPYQDSGVVDGGVAVPLSTIQPAFLANTAHSS
jgi:hypothetical protein